MKVTYNWLKELVDIQASADEVAARLAGAGVEVESIDRRCIPAGVVAAKVVTAEKHPDSDHLSVCTVDAGTGALLTVVCGAPNVCAGMKSALATAGTAFSPDFIVKKQKVRGVESAGMLCSERELGISDDHEGIVTLPPEWKTGEALSSYLPDDTVFTLELTPNRGDCLSVLGIAREVSALFGKPLKPIALTPPEAAGETIDTCIRVSIEDSAGCPRYMGRLLRGVTIKPSPLWLKYRLTAHDIRPLSNVVDVTNYILLLFGQPMHSFDYDRIAGKTIVVKKARQGQTFTTLDKTDRTLTAEDLLICDGSGPVAIAGVMGGQASGITDATKNVFLECAYFNPVGIRKTSKRLDLSSESSYRFERGVDPQTGCEQAVDTAATLIQSLAGGSVVQGVIDEHPAPVARKKIPLRPSRVCRILGVSIGKDTMVELLRTLQIFRVADQGDTVLFEAPQFRHDLESEIDLIEEVGRMYRYDTVPASVRATVAMDQPVSPRETICGIIRRSLAAAGMHETVTNNLTSGKNCALLTPAVAPVVLLNPLNPEMSRMRTTLLGSLLDVTAYNLNRSNTHNKLFELGRTFTSSSTKLPREREVLGILLEGDFLPASWAGPAAPADFFFLKTILQTVRISLGLPPFIYTPAEPEHPWFDAESASVNNQDITGVAGRIHDRITGRLGIKSAVYYAELDITGLLELGVAQPLYSPLPRFPAIKRDLCFVMEEQILSSTISGEICSLSDLIEYIEPFDLYRGEPLEKGMKSIAYAIHLRSAQRTLTDADAEAVCTKIIETMKARFNAVLR